MHEADTDLPNDGLDESAVLSYGTGWQLCEESINSSTDDARDRRVDYFWELRGLEDYEQAKICLEQALEGCIAQLGAEHQRSKEIQQLLAQIDA